MHKVSQFCTSLPTLVTFQFSKTIATLYWVGLCVFDLHFPNGVEYLFMCVLGTRRSSLEKCKSLTRGLKQMLQAREGGRGGGRGRASDPSLTCPSPWLSSLSFYKRFLLLFCSLKHLPRTPVSVRSNQSSRTRRHLMRVYCKDLA